MYTIETNRQGYIHTIYADDVGAFSEEDMPEGLFQDLVDDNGNLQFKLEDGVIVQAPQKAKARQLESRRKAWVVDQISRRYDQNRESELVRENMSTIMTGGEGTQAFLEYHAYVEAVRAESHRRVESQDWSDYAAPETDASTRDAESSGESPAE